MTGANSGIGKATAIGLGRAGADVVVNYVFGPEAADEVVEEIRSHGVRAYAHQADVSQEEQVVAMVDLMDYVVGATLYVDGGMSLFPGFATGG